MAVEPSTAALRAELEHLRHAHALAVAQTEHGRLLAHHHHGRHCRVMTGIT
ncbi:MULTISPECIES: hypothetical protein [Streptomyces]|uniref:Uncharacterized protein n=1 Tax=Streptomyces flavovirens TaxID=52258 RepID=A0ABV8MZT9_9ACTN|nr:hypothetical protein [Streptomyces sp. MBT51]MBK3596416.1 hypothetical protein [Streptomyces sp. MBT51]